MLKLYCGLDTVLIKGCAYYISAGMYLIASMAQDSTTYPTFFPVDANNLTCANIHL